MSTRIYSQHNTAWSGVASSSGMTMTATATGVLKRTFERLRPGHAHTATVRLYATAKTGTTVGVLIQGRSHEVPAGSWQTITQDLDPARTSFQIEVTGVRTADIAVEITTPDTVTAQAIPADVLALEALLPIPTDAMVWDITRWDRTAWNKPRPIPGTLVWDEGAWDRTYWLDETRTEEWTDILGPVTEITCTRGINADGPVLKAQAGTMTIRARDALDPRETGMSVGTPIRLNYWPQGHQTWAGTVSAIAVTPRKDGGYDTIITAVDVVARLASITRYGARPDGGGTETWRQRLTRLLNSMHAVPLTVAANSIDPVCPTVWETSVAAHLDALVATTGGAWNATRYSGITVRASLPTTAPAITLTDSHDDDAETTFVYHYSDGPAAWDTSQLVAAIDATTHTAAPDDDGEWHATDQTITVANETTAAAWTGMRTTVDLLTPTEQATREAATRLLRRASTAPLMTSVTLWPCPASGPSASSTGAESRSLRDIARISYLDPMEPVTAIQRGERATELVASITHRITPTTWRTDLTLTPTERTP